MAAKKSTKAPLTVESFFVRHAYFMGANDPYKALKTALKAEINEEAWATLNSDTSRPFDKPTSGRVAVKVINHLGDGGTVNAFDTMANGFSFGSI
jgi:hypothetical protein